MAGGAPFMPLRAMAPGRLRPGTGGRARPEVNCALAYARTAIVDTQRLILFFVFGFSLLMLWDAWEKDHRPRPAPQTQVSPAATIPAPSGKSATPPAAPAAAS